MYGMYTMPISSGLIVDQVINCQITLMPNFEDVKNAINKSNKKRSDNHYVKSYGRYNQS